MCLSSCVCQVFPRWTEKNFAKLKNVVVVLPHSRRLKVQCDFVFFIRARSHGSFNLPTWAEHIRLYGMCSGCYTTPLKSLSTSATARSPTLKSIYIRMPRGPAEKKPLVGTSNSFLSNLWHKIDEIKLKYYPVALKSRKKLWAFTSRQLFCRPRSHRISPPAPFSSLKSNDTRTHYTATIKKMRTNMELWKFHSP